MSAPKTVRMLRTLALSVIALGSAQADTIKLPEGVITVTSKSLFSWLVCSKT